MKRTIEIKSPDLLAYGQELTAKIMEYMRQPLLLNCGRANTSRLRMSDNNQVFIHHTHKSVIVERMN